VNIGVDIGQVSDPTAIAVVRQVRETDMPLSKAQFNCHFLERLPLGTGYADVANRVAEVVSGVCAREERRPSLYVDITGVGRPVAEMMIAALKERQKEEPKTRWEFIGCSFTHGDRLKMGDWVGPWREASVGKAFLCSRLQALLQTGRIRWPRTAETEQLKKELLAYEIKVDADANDRYGAFKVGTHDDMVTALGLAVVHQFMAQRTI
jgi:hypothetical protein